MNALEKARACPIHTKVAHACIVLMQIPPHRVSYVEAVKQANFPAFSVEDLVKSVKWPQIKAMILEDTGWDLEGAKEPAFGPHDYAEEFLEDRVGKFAGIGGKGTKSVGFVKLCDHNAHLFAKKETVNISHASAKLQKAADRIEAIEAKGISGMPNGSISVDYGTAPPALPPVATPTITENPDD